MTNKMWLDVESSLSYLAPVKSIDKRAITVANEYLLQGNLKTKGITNLLYSAMNDSNAFLIFIRSYYG